MADSKTTNKPKSVESRKDDDQRMPLGMKNYKLMLIGFAVIVIGFLLMTGGGSDDPNQFDYGMFSFRRITLAPIVVLGGFAFVIYAIMKKR